MPKPMDMQQSVAYQNRHIAVKADTYAQCGDADTVAITAAAPYIMGQRRLDMLKTASNIVRYRTSDCAERVGHQSLGGMLGDGLDVGLIPYGEKIIALGAPCGG